MESLLGRWEELCRAGELMRHGGETRRWRCVCFEWRGVAKEEDESRNVRNRGQANGEAGCKNAKRMRHTATC